ncbi:uncharacterized protein LOC112504487, partial [Cynara cardunculus var. scolymus]|uniref:uncharacterized protein LOC112504487 n=1 Tax=Cynara cardunculus var. scolymus TaxID=59895 RepID=UPI000D624A0D
MSGEGIKVDFAEVEAITNWPKPTNVSKVRSFLGLAGYYQRFVENFSRIALLMTKLLRKEFKFVWGEEQGKGFEKLRKILVTTSVLTLPFASGGFQVYSDASKCSLDCVLMQHDKLIADEVLASIMVEPTLVSQIEEAQQEDGELWAILQKAKDDSQPDFRVDAK